MKKRLFFDMDNVLVDFKSGLDKVDESVKACYRKKTPDDKDRVDEIPGIFSLMDPMPGAIEAVHKLSEVYDVYILSTAPWGNPLAWTEKVLWLMNHFGDLFKKKVIITHCKDFIQGDYLIDDSPNNGACNFQGEWIHFQSNRFPNWHSVLDYLLPEQSSIL